jgi:hypothetical protein
LDILHMMSADSYVRFRRSARYEEYLNRDVAQEVISKRASMWVPDFAQSQCMLCDVPFSFLKRRHHCRSCGQLCCDRCSKHKIRIREEDVDTSRVCDMCVSHTQQAAAEKVISPKNRTPNGHHHNRREIARCSEVDCTDPPLPGRTLCVKHHVTGSGSPVGSVTPIPSSLMASASVVTATPASFMMSSSSSSSPLSRSVSDARSGLLL